MTHSGSTLIESFQDAITIGRLSHNHGRDRGFVTGKTIAEMAPVGIYAAHSIEWSKFILGFICIKVCRYKKTGWDQRMLKSQIIPHATKRFTYVIVIMSSKS